MKRVSGINERQNSEINIQRLAAQRQLYSNVKFLQYIRIALSIPVILMISGIVFLLKSQSLMTFFGFQPYDASWVLAIASFCILCIDLLILAPIQRNKKKLAAVIQEEFDCNVLDIPWNDTIVSECPEREAVISYSESYFKNNRYEGLINWYACPDESIIPLTACRVICQRSNITWDARLREKYVILISIVGSISAILIILFAAFHDFTIKEFLFKILLPLLPIAKLVIEDIWQNQTVINNLHEIKIIIEKHWQSILANDLNDSELRTISRQIQDRIYHNRNVSPTIPDCLYHMLRQSDESLMVKTAKQMEKEYRDNNKGAKAI